MLNNVFDIFTGIITKSVIRELTFGLSVKQHDIQSLILLFIGSLNIHMHCSLYDGVTYYRTLLLSKLEFRH